MSRKSIATFKSIIHGALSRLFCRDGDRNSGQILVVYALTSIVIMGMAGFALDWGFYFTTRRSYQKVADTCAVVGAQGILAGSALTDARNCVTSNGVPDGITVNLPPASGRYVGSTTFIEVLINRNISTLFLQVFGIRTVSIGARAVAGAYATADYAVMALKPPGNIVRSNGGNRMLVNGSACSRDDFLVNGSMTVSYYAVADGAFTGGLPAALGVISGAGADPCLDPNYPLPALPPGPAPFPLLPNLNLNSAASCNAARAPLFVGPAASIRIDCPARTEIQIQGPVGSVDVRNSNNADVRLLGPSTYGIVDVNGTGNVRFTRGWYDQVSVKTQGGASVTFDPGVYYINTFMEVTASGVIQGGASPEGPGNLTFVVGREMWIVGNGDVNLWASATGVTPYNMLVYHIGTCVPLFGVAGNCVSKYDRILLEGNGANRTYNGSIYSPLGAPCDDPCIDVRGNAGNTNINGQVIAPSDEFSGTGLTISFIPDSRDLVLKPFLAE